MKRLVLTLSLLSASPAVAQQIWTDGSVRAPNPVTDGTWDAGGAIQVGYAGSGTLNIATGGYVVSSGSTSYVGWQGSGRVSMTGGTWIANGGIGIGAFAHGAMDINRGSIISNDYVFVGTHGQSASVTLNNPGSRLEVWNNALIIGKDGSILAYSGSRIDAAGIHVNSGELSMIGPDTQAISRNQIIITDGGKVTTSNGVIVQAGYVGVSGEGSQLSLSGPQTEWIVREFVLVGSTSASPLSITAGASLTADRLIIGATSLSGSVVVSGNGSALNSESISVGSLSSGTLSISNGASVTTREANFGSKTHGFVSVFGPSSSFRSEGITLGGDGSGAILVGDSALVKADVGILLFGSSYIAIVGGINGPGILETSFIGGFRNGGFDIDGGILRASSDSVNFLASTQPITVGMSGGVIDTNGHSIEAYGAIGGDGSLTVDGRGSLTLWGDNSISGATSIASGTLALAGDGSLASSAGIAVEGIFDISRTQGTSVRAISGAGTINLGAQVLTLTAADGEFSGTISGSGGLALDGGKLILSGNSPYTGATTIIGGTLALSGTGSIASSSGVEANGTFDISGTFAGASIHSLSGAGDVVLGGQHLTLTNGSGSFTGVISGAGAIVLSGGRQLLAGANTYSGGTNVTAGTLVLGASSGAGTGPISLAAGTTLGFTNGINVANPIELGGAVTFNLAYGTAISSGPLSGAGSIAFTGEGIISLTGDNSAFGGSTDVGGVLSVNGTLGGTITVQAGGTLKGNGSVGELTAETGGTVAPGNSIGTLTATGSVTFAAGSAYAVEINPAGASDRLIVTGTATLNGAAVQVTKAPGSYLPGTQYTILSAGGGIVGTFGGIIQDLPFVALDLSYGANDVVLSVTRSGILFPSVAVTANQRATAGAVEALGQGNAVYNAVVSQTSVVGAQQAFNTLDGEIYPSALSVLQQESLILRRAVLDRARVPASAGTAAPLAYAAGSAAGADVVGMAGSPNAFWAQAFGAWSRIDGNGNAATISGDTAGVIVGYDRTFAGNGADWRLGFAAGYSSSGYQVDDRSSSFSSDNAHVALYGGTSMGALGIRAGAAYSWADISASRTVAFPGFLNALDADTSARTGQVFGEVGYGLSFAKVKVEPFAGLAYVNVDMDGFTELGGPSALTASGSSAGVTYSTLGARLSVPFRLGALPAAFNGTLAWQHAFGDTSPDTLFAFGPGTLPFSISGVPIASNAALVKAGPDLKVSANAALSVFYAGQLSETGTSNMVKGSFTATF